MDAYLDWKYILVHALAALFVGWLATKGISEWWKGRKR